jgi:uroporphyrinogen-III synthase
VGHGEKANPAAITRSRVLCALVTRPREEALSLAAALAGRGIDAIIEPMMDVHYSSAAVPDLANVQAVLCTSGNGVRALARITRERDRPLLAVGDATASRARAEGFTNVASAGGDIADLVRLAVMRLRPQGGRLLHIAGEVVAGDLSGALRVQGFTIDRIVLYQARPVAALSESVIRALCSSTIDFALFFSPRSAAIFVKLVKRAGLTGCCRAVTAVSISPAVDAALSALPWHDRQVAERPSQGAMLDSLDRAVGERQQL